MGAKRLMALADELYRMILEANKQARKLNVPISRDKKYFVEYEGREFVNPRHMLVVSQLKVIQLCQFLNKHLDVDDADLTVILSLRESDFALFRDIQSVIPNLIEEIRTHDDEKYISSIYSATKVFRDKEATLI